MYFKMDQPAKPPVQRSQCSIQHGRNNTANNIYKCWTSCNKCKYLFLQYSVSNQKHNSCKIYLKIIQVVSKGRKISWLAGGVIGYDSETKGATHGQFHQSLVPIGQISFRGEDFKWFFFVEFSIFSNGGHVGWERVSEENIKIQKVNDGRTDDGHPVVANAHMTLRVRWVKELLRKWLRSKC
jgi:hypothetical protein